MIPAATPLDVCVRFGGDEVQVLPRGEIDLVSAPEFDALVEAVVERGHTRVILDLAEVGFLDASALNARVAARLSASSGTLTIRSPSDLARRMLHITSLGDLIEAAPPDEMSVAATASEQDTNARAVVRSLDELAASRSRERTIDAALHLVVALAAATITSTDSASVTLRRRGRLTTVAATDHTAARLDDDQYASGEGPCVSAATSGQRVHLESAAEEPRWPRFVPHVVDAGITSVLSTPLLLAAAPVGALNMYSRGDDGFGTDQQELAELIAAQAAGILNGEDNEATTTERVRRLQDALRTREAIARAQGILIGRHSISADDAAARLHHMARQADIPLRQLAADIVTSPAGTTDSSHSGR
jgi:anti-anti-sigma factor